MATYDLGKVVGDSGEKGDDGSTIWYTSTAPTYASSKYTFTISNLTGKTGFEIAVNDIIFYSTYYYIVSTVGSTTVDCTTRINIKGSDASVTIVDNLTSDSSTSALSAKQGKALNTNKVATSAIATSWGSTTSDSKVPSEKLAKDTLDGKQATLVSGTNIKTINNNSLLGSGNIDIQSSSVDIATSWGSTLSDTKVPSEKLTKNSLDAKADSSSLATVATTGDYDDLTDKPTIPSDVSDLTDSTGIIPTDVSDLTDTQDTAFTPKSHQHGNLTNDGKVGTNANYIIITTTGGAITSVQKLGNITYDGKVGSNANYFVYTTTSGTVTSKQKIGNITTSGAIGSTSGLPIITTTSGVLTTGSFGSTAGTFAEGNHSHSGYVSATKVTSWSGTVSDSNVPTEKLVKNSLDDKVSKSSTTGLLKNDGTVMTSGTGSSNWAVGNHSHSGYVSGTKVTSWSSTVSDSNIPSEKLVKDYVDGLIGSAITYIVGSGS